MKRQFTLLLASVLVVFALTACGGNDKDTNQDNNGQNTVGEDIQNAGEDIMDAGEDVLDPDNNNIIATRTTGPAITRTTRTPPTEVTAPSPAATPPWRMPSPSRTAVPAYPTDKCCAMPGSTIPTGF